MTADSVELDYPTRRRLWSIVESGPERCGVLYGNVSGSVAQVAGMKELYNVAADPEHQFQFDPEEQASVWADAEVMGYEVLAIWHTHPSGPQAPSSTDVANMQPWLLYAILWPEVLPVVLEEGLVPAMAVYKLGDGGDEHSIELALVPWTEV